MNATFFKKQFGYTYGTIRLNCRDLRHAESLVQPHPGGNCLNWVVGHVIASRNGALELLNQPPFWNKLQVTPYARGSNPIKADDAAQFADLLAELKRSQQGLLAALDSKTNEDYAEMIGEETLAEKIGFYLFHESYHAGQTGILRRIAGKEGMIK